MSKTLKDYLLESYSPPLWAEKLAIVPEKRLRLFQGPTPLEPLQFSRLPRGVKIWIKRDDQTGSLTTGNKVRKLEFLLARALEEGADSIITCGGIQSNHCRAVAAVSVRLGLKPYLLLRTHRPEKAETLRGNLLLDRALGAEIIPITPEQYRRRGELSLQLARALREEGRKPYIIPEGGSNGLGSWGYLEFARELAGQTAQLGIAISDVVFACGSGGTSAGLAVGTALGGYPWRLHPVTVCDDADYFHRVIGGIFEEMGFEGKSRELLDIIDGYKGLGYAINTPQELEFILQVASETGIILDPVYSGKAFLGLLRELEESAERFAGRDILFIHTGGIFGLYDKIEELEPLIQTRGEYFTWAFER